MFRWRMPVEIHPNGPAPDSQPHYDRDGYVCPVALSPDQLPILEPSLCTRGTKLAVDSARFRRHLDIRPDAQGRNSQSYYGDPFRKTRRRLLHKGPVHGWNTPADANRLPVSRNQQCCILLDRAEPFHYEMTDPRCVREPASFFHSTRRLLFAITSSSSCIRLDLLEDCRRWQRL